METNISYLTQRQAQQIDADLMGPTVGYSVDQLMELAGLSVAQAVAHFVASVASAPPDTAHASALSPASSLSPAGAAALRSRSKKVLVVCGPGNNGGDGLVAGRHLRQFGFEVDIWYPRPGEKDLYKRLVKQLDQHRVPVLHEPPPDFSQYLLLVDAVFGFSFGGALRAPFDAVLQQMKNSSLPLVAVDVPSGWDVEKGDVSGEGVKPVCLISLTAPKKFAENLKLVHYVGGRFVPATIVEKYKLSFPIWPGTDQIVRIR